MVSDQEGRRVDRLTTPSVAGLGEAGLGVYAYGQASPKLLAKVGVAGHD
jgi:hypothetical protein